jgi:hypothetical protein
MSFLKGLYRIGFKAVACMLLLSCGGGSGSSPSIQSPTWQLDGSGFEQFITNDPQHYNSSHWFHYNSSYESPMSTVTATLKKQSGSPTTGYGIIFCYQDTSNFYYLSIETHGHYHVQVKVGGSYSTILDWSPSANLNTGYSVENIVSVVRTGPGTFAIYFNGVLETIFGDNTFSSGYAGFWASISEQTHENFPYTPVDVRFKMSSPVIFP